MTALIPVPVDLTPAKARALEALLEGRKHDEVAAAAGIATRTLSRWLRTPAFRAALSDGARAALDRAAQRLQAGAVRAADYLAAAAAGEVPADHARIRAAEAVIAHAQNFAESDIAAALEALERRLLEREAKPWG